MNKLNLFIGLKKKSQKLYAGIKSFSTQIKNNKKLIVQNNNLIFMHQGLHCSGCLLTSNYKFKYIYVSAL